MRVITTSVLFFALATSYAYASFSQQGGKLVGTGAVGNAQQGLSVALSADGNTAVVGGNNDNTFVGAAWVYTRSGGVWGQQGAKLVGTGAVGFSEQGFSVALSADGNTAVVGGFGDNGGAGAVWVYTRSGGVWTQQGGKLVANDAMGAAQQGRSVALSADGNTAIVGGFADNGSAGAAWVYTRSGGVWTQQGGKLVGNDAMGAAQQGRSVALSADGNTAVVGGDADNSNAGAAWVFTRSGGVWSQQGSKLVGTGAVGPALQGSVAVSADGNTAVVGGFADNNSTGAAWVFTRSGGVWTQQGGKLVGTGGVGAGDQGFSVTLSADGSTAVVGGRADNGDAGAAWVFRRSGGVWTQHGGKLVGTGAVGGARQGRSVALSADGSTLLAGGPSDNSSAGAVWAYIAPAELVAGGVAGWYAPSLPYKSGVGNSSTAPTVLDGNAFNTIFAYSYENSGPTAASGFQASEYIDGALILTWTPGALAGGAEAFWHSTPRTVRGGLHTMGFRNDITNVIDELDEGNNNHASQWVWSPLPMTLGVPVTRPGLPDPQGGWEDIPINLPRYSNVDGLRSPTFSAPSGSFNNRWGVVALTPIGVGTNPDLQVSDTLSTGPSDGFRSPDEISARVGNATDLVLVDAENSAITLDVGLYKSAGNAPVKVHAESSTYLFDLGGSESAYGPFSLGPDSLVALFSLSNLSDVSRGIRLKNLSGNANLDFMLFGHTDPSRLYNTGQAAASVAANGDGADELFIGTAPADPALVVLKAGSSDVGKTALYQIIVSSQPVGVDDDFPTRIAFGRISPNPAHAEAALRFDLPREMEVDLAAYDVGGRRVSTLANGTWNAGRHVMRWSTLGDGGQPLPSGMYLVRFRAGDYQATQRVLVIR